MKRKTIYRIITVLMIAVMVLALTGCGEGASESSGSGSSKSSPKDVVNALFDSVDKHDAKKFLGCFEKDFQEEILEYTDKEEIEEQLTDLDAMLEEEYGKNWRKQLKVTSSEKIGTEDGITYYEVTVETEDDEQTLTVIKVKNKYYIDPDTFDDFM